MVLSILLTLVVMILLAVVIEKLVLKHLINQDPIVLFMATIGLRISLRDSVTLMWGSEIKRA